MSNNQIPLLGTTLPAQIIDNNISGHAITDCTITIHDVNAFSSYMQASLPSFTQLFYYPAQTLVQIQTSGDTADAATIDSLVQAYTNPLPLNSIIQNLGIAPIETSSTNWKAVFVLTIPYHENRKLIESTVSTALTPASSDNPRSCNSEYSMRFVAIDCNTVLGTSSVDNMTFQDIITPLTNVPTRAFDLEIQMKNSGGAYVTLRNVSLTYDETAT